MQLFQLLHRKKLAVAMCLSQMHFQVSIERCGIRCANGRALWEGGDFEKLREHFENIITEVAVFVGALGCGWYVWLGHKAPLKE